jgi:NAD-dependent deacetylase
MKQKIDTTEAFATIASLIREQGKVVAFTGAGISVESGIPAFRGGQGLWEKYDPMEYAHIGAFNSNPEKVWIMLREMSALIFDARPNAAHAALGDLEKRGYLASVITQNVDGLHQVAGNSDVIEYHGNHRRLVCTRCHTRIPLSPEVVGVMPYPACEQCGRALKPDVVFFGEGIPMLEAIRANQAVEACRMMIIVGTSGVVYPAAEMPYVAKAKGATIVEINMEPTPFTETVSDYFFGGSAARVLPAILAHLDGGP